MAIVLAGYAIANAGALTVSRQEHRPVRLIPIVGCLVLAVTLPGGSAMAGAAAVAVGACIYVGTAWLGTRS